MLPKRYALRNTKSLQAELEITAQTRIIVAADSPIRRHQRDVITRWNSGKDSDASRVFSSARHLATVCLAIIGLYIQIIAATACLAGPPLASDISGAGLFPICHASGGGNDTSPVPGGDHGPATQHSCPLCALHCQAALASPSPSPAFESLFRLSAEITRAPFLTRSVAHFAAGAPPRGPPAA
jgi:hypothetical protein